MEAGRLLIPEAACKLLTSLNNPIIVQVAWKHLLLYDPEEQSA